MKYISEIDSAYSDIVNAGCNIIVIKPVASIYDPVMDTETKPGTALFSAINSVQTKIEVESTAEFSVPCIAAIESERIYVFDKDSSYLYAIRGFDSSAAGHESETLVIYDYACFETYAVIKNYSESLLLATIQKGDKQMLIPAKNFPFILDQTCIIYQQDKKWNIVNILTVEPGGESIIYKVQVRN